MATDDRSTASPAGRLLSSPWLVAATVAAIACLALSVPFLVAPGVRLEFDEDSPAPPPYTRGFHPPEGAGWPDSYAWTELNARLILPDLPRSTPWTLTIRAHSATPAGAAVAPVAMAEHGRSLGAVRFAPVGGAHYADVHLHLPAADERGLRLDIASAQARLVAIACGAGAALWGGAAAAIAVGALGYLSSWLYLPMFDSLIGAAWLALAVLGAGLVTPGQHRVMRGIALVTDSLVGLSHQLVRGLRSTSVTTWSRRRCVRSSPHSRRLAVIRPA